MQTRLNRGLLLVGLGIFSLTLGCNNASVSRERAERTERGYIFYLDGAGGGSAISNYGGGVRRGMEAAGYRGYAKMFHWQTDLGVGADQVASEAYKRGKARELAKEIVEYRQNYPNAPITVIGLSAGTAVAVFALEELPAKPIVDDVVLLSGSLAAQYDLTKALQRVNNRMYVFTSPSDAVLRFLLPLGGTADRTSDSIETIGLNGVSLPANASTLTRMQYAKVSQIPWNPEFRDYGNHGGHTDFVKAPFIRAVVAPMILREGVTLAVDDDPLEVDNPDFTRWANFQPGSYALWEGTQVADGKQHRLKMRAELIERNPEFLIVERTIESIGSNDGPFDDARISRHHYVTRRIDQTDHPATDPRAVREDLGLDSIVIGSDSYQVRRYRVRAEGNYVEWGQKPVADYTATLDIPGGLTSMRLRTGSRTGPVEYDAQLMEYRSIPVMPRGDDE